MECILVPFVREVCIYMHGLVLCVKSYPDLIIIPGMVTTFPRTVTQYVKDGHGQLDLEFDSSMLYSKVFQS